MNSVAKGGFGYTKQDPLGYVLTLGIAAGGPRTLS